MKHLLMILSTCMCIIKWCRTNGVNTLKVRACKLNLKHKHVLELTQRNIITSYQTHFTQLNSTQTPLNNRMFNWMKHSSTQLNEIGLNSTTKLLATTSNSTLIFFFYWQNLLFVFKYMRHILLVMKHKIHSKNCPLKFLIKKSINVIY